jgi:hypothetical protein
MLERLKIRTRHWLHDIARSASSESLAALQHQIIAAAASLKVAQVQLCSHYQTLVKQKLPLPSIFDTGYRVYSDFEEDGMLVFLFAVLGTKSKTFIDIGSANGLCSNCANLAIHFGWHGLFIDANRELVDHGTKVYASHLDTSLYPPKFLCARVTRENINEIISNAGFERTIDLLSIDIDGNDYWIWDALKCIRPRVVIIETHVEFGSRNIVVPYDKDHIYPGAHREYHGASPVAMVTLANALGYQLVGANRFGFNTIYVAKEERPDFLPEVAVETILQHPRTRERFKLVEDIKDWPYVEGGSGYPGRPVPVAVDFQRTTQSK